MSIFSIFSPSEIKELGSGNKIKSQRDKITTLKLNIKRKNAKIKKLNGIIEELRCKYEKK